MQAIITKYIAPTNTRGARIKATAGKGQTIIVSYNYARTIKNNHLDAMTALIEKLKWQYESLTWVQVDIETGCVFVAIKSRVELR